MASREELLAKAKGSVKKELSKRDLVVMQSVRALDDIDEAKGILVQRATDWFRINFPEMHIGDDDLLKLAAEFGSRETFDERKAENVIGKEKAREVAMLAKTSFGGNFDANDAAALKSFSKQVLGLQEERKALEKYTEEQMRKHFPNISELAEPLLAARLLVIAGGIEKMARMPASTIQVLGAEKALFSHLRKGSKPPKHGIIFNNPHLSSAPAEERGRIARELATKVAIASRADAFTHVFIAKKLKQKFDARIKQIKAQTASSNSKK
ncbi:MAG TPA: hypothetical protein VGQ00_04265 [Candidatus Norongarragalinales archaeon]|jgi:nucleolar protein 56|nr:hypothetical protein [Candidatus Norongarragalinales archaeon]